MQNSPIFFRPMRRAKQALSREECVQLLMEEPRGVLSVLGDNGYPYGVPLTHWYDPESGKLYFHGARIGHKLDALRQCGKASFCVCDQGFRRPGEWALNIRSVIVFGRVREVNDPAAVTRILTALGAKFTDDPDYARQELARAGAAVCCLELTPEHISGKLVNES